MGAEELTQELFSRLGARDVDGALALAWPDAQLRVHPAGLHGSVAEDGPAFLSGLIDAFVDLRVTVERLFVGDQGTAVAEVTIEGTQTGELFGMVAIGRHLDLEQAWFVDTDGDRISAITAYWCQLQLYRRLGAGRLDDPLAVVS